MLETRTRVWFEYQDNVMTLARWLVDKKDFTVNNLLDYFEQPYKWTDEYKEMRAAKEE